LHEVVEDVGVHRTVASTRLRAASRDGAMARLTVARSVFTEKRKRERRRGWRRHEEGV
jgi:hypothetical protein